MGGALVTGADPAHLFACQVVRAEYERALSQDPDSDPVLIDTTDSQYRDRLVHLYTAALVEWQLPLEVCRQPAVVLFKYLLLGVGERADYHQAVMGAAEGRERQKGGGGGGGKGGGKGGKKEDYSASFGGTEADSRNEREAAAILRGGEEAAEEEPPLLLPPLLTPPWVPWELQCLRTGGGWGRVMGGSGCYLYLHALTKELLSVRPADFVEHTEEGGVGVGDGGGVGGELDPSNGLTCVCMADLLAGVGEVTAGGKTALLVDASQEQGVRAFYSYKGVLEVRGRV
ncbi:hypothetical protein B484DRAFT_50183 [Ochromonadaceae sp. CCMP2298]|nr:hypothetical protein B484DRAFT_50183 [Ochromonadaceae sp. CCMP2298]